MREEFKILEQLLDFDPKASNAPQFKQLSSLAIWYLLKPLWGYTRLTLADNKNLSNGS